MTTTKKFRWSSPQDWLGDRINDRLAKTRTGPLSSEQDGAELRRIVA
jgi:hypothetical protein